MENLSSINVIKDLMTRHGVESVSYTHLVIG